MKAQHTPKDPRPVAEVKLQEYAILLWRLCGHDGAFVFHPPNEGARSKRTGANLLKQGMMPGVADLVCTFKGGRVGYIELKTPKGRLSEEQRAFRDKCERMGVPYALCRSSDEISTVFREWGVLRDGVQIGTVPRPDFKKAA